MDEAKGTVERVGGYRVVRRLATGGTSDVLLAKAEGPHGFERTVVLKLLLSQYRNDESVAKMFAREAAAYARLSHASIVQLFDFFALEGQLVMVLEYVDGPPLSRLRSMLKSVGQSIDDRAAIYVASRIFSALSAAHDATGEGGIPTPVIHRDVNPSNVLVPWDGHVKLADFGIAKITGVSHESAAGLLKGTFGYMAPEQVKGDAVTPRADVYAASIILWELLAGRRAFQRGALPEIEALRSMAEPHIASLDIVRPDVDPVVRDLVKRGLEPRAEKRNVTAEEMVATLQDLVSPDEGRERLAALLATVRHEPRAAFTSAPPAPEVSPRPGATMTTGKLAPSALPRPAPSVSRATTPLGSATPPPRRTASGALAAAVAPKIPSTTAATARTPKHVADVVIPASAERASTPPSVEGRESTPPALALRDAIEEVLSAVPSSIPPEPPPGRLPLITSEFAPVETPARETEPAEPPSASAEPVASAAPIAPVVTLPSAEPPSAEPPSTPDPPSAPGRFGNIPPPPPPLSATMPMNGAAAAGVSGVADTIRDVPAAVAMRESSTPPSDRITAVASPLEATARGATAPMPAYAPAPALAPAPLTPVPSVVVQPSAVGAPPAPPPADRVRNHPTLRRPPAARSSWRGIIALLFLGAIAVGIGGTMLFLRWKRSQAARTQAAAMSAPVPPAPAATSAAGVAPSAAPLPTAPPEASALPAEPRGDEAAAASSAPPAKATAPAPAAAVPAGMGLLKTTHATPGRRIFVDERTVGQTPESVLVRCGSRVVKLGSSGRPQRVTVPCGGELTVDR